ncbi:armadillo repeat-containing protein 5-like [Stylophora pistillata]|uniref:armadillo repeat-containing protein 5-like n=1 Tax=Stylophora pistillata TaxID=50429 RepID=UPI000C052BC5|nr:armadillo repeat-containing protein 5-like [Stylophora pistillata]
MAATAVAKYIESLIKKLSLKSESKTKKTLIALTSMTRHKNNVDIFCEKGGLRRLIALIQLPNETIADMALSVLANCARQEESRREIRRLDGITVLAEVLKNNGKTSILNRTSRAVANLAADELSVQVMEELGVIHELVKCFTKTSDSDCQQSVLRALRMVCTNSERKKAIVDLDAIKTIMEVLQSDKPSLVNCCIKTVAELTKECSKEFAQQVQDCGSVKYIVKLTSSDLLQVRNSATLSLANLAHHAHVRVCIGSEGGIEALTEQLKKDELGHVTVKAIEGLCYCCREGINRLRVRDSSALELLLKILLSGKWLSLEKKIVAAFAQFCHSEVDLEILLNGDLVPGLMNHLNRIIHQVQSKNDHDDDHDDGLTDHQSFSADFYTDYSMRTTSVKSVFSDVSAEALKDETFLKKLEETAREVTDTKVTGQLSKFKRRLKLKPSPIPTTPPPGVCTIGQSVFSFASRQTDTTTLVSVCTSSRSVSSLASSWSDFATLRSASCPRVLPSHQDFSKTQRECDLHEPTAALTCDDPTSMCIENQTQVMLGSPVGLHPASGSVQGEPVKKSPVSPLSPKVQSGLHHNRSLGQSALTLLLRIAHMTNPSIHLVNKDCIGVLLDYLCLVNNPNPKCARILNLLAANPLCFRDLIVHGAVVAIHHQLCFRNCEYQESTGPLKPCDPDLNAYSFEEQRLPTPFNSQSSEDSVFKPKDKISPNAKYQSMSSATQSHCQETGNHLLKILSNQAQTPCGKGEIEHILLTGSKEECEDCVLALPLLCRTTKLRQQMLVDRKGLRMLCDIFKSLSPTGKTFPTVVESLIVLANELQLKFPSNVTRKEGEGISKDLTSSTNEETNLEASDDLHQRKKLKKDFSNIQASSSNDEKDCLSCLYHANSLGLPDATFVMDNGDKVVAHKQLMMSASDFFAAMFSDSFLESTQSDISLQDISVDVFGFALHHMYGCKIIPNEQISSEMISSQSCCDVLKRKVMEIQMNHDELQFFLELLTLADRFFLDKLRTLCEKFLVNLINASTVLQVYNYGYQCNSPQLCLLCLTYLLTINPSNLPNHMYIFKELFLSSEQGHLADQLYEILLSHLKH